MIYLDHNATSPLLAEVLEAMRPWLGAPGNPASVHRAGQRAASAVEVARDHVAALVGGSAAGVVFTSGATEANHLFLRGHARRTSRRRAVVSPIEHPCVYGALDALDGWVVDRLAVGRDGVCTVGDVPRDTAVVSLMAANHETGALQPIAAARRAAEEAGAAVHVDATQAAGRVALDLAGVDGVVLSSHKLGGPGGVGALVLPDGEAFPALLTGGAQERGRRAGTVFTAGVVGFGEACRLARVELNARRQRWAPLDAMIRQAVVHLGGRVVSPLASVPNTVCFVVPGVSAETIVQALDLRGVCVSAGAACASGSVGPSPVLAAMGDPEPKGGVRISLGPRTAEAEVGAALDALGAVIDGIRLAEGWDT